MNAQEAKVLRTGPLATPTDLKPNAVRDLAGALNILLADMFGLFVKTMDMLAELRDDNKDLAARLRETHDLCDEHGDVATASLLEVWIDEAERRTWFLFEATRAAE